MSRPATRATPRGARAQRPHAGTAARRDEILQAAMAVFGARGYRNGSLLEIAELAGMTHAGVLHHFGTKEQLLIAVLEYRDRADVADFEGHHAPLGEAFLRHLVATATKNAQRPGVVQAYTVLAGESVTDDHPAQSFFRDRLAGLRDMVRHAVSATVPDAASEDADVVASAIIATMDGLQVQWLLQPEDVEMSRIVATTIDALLAWLREQRRVSATDRRDVHEPTEGAAPTPRHPITDTSSNE